MTMRDGEEGVVQMSLYTVLTDTWDTDKCTVDNK